jgi:hypothetical protein
MKIMKKFAVALVAAALVSSVAMPVSAATKKDSIASASCKKVGKPTKESYGLPVCQQFFGSGGSIHFPADTPEMQYGTISMEMMSDSNAAPSYMLVTRDGEKHELGDVSSLLPKVPASYWAQTIVALDLRNKIFGVIPQIFVPRSTMVAGFAGKSFVGSIESFSPPTGAKKMNPIRIDMDKAVAGSGLMGHVVNFKRSIIESNTDMCKAKLLSDAVTTRWVKSSLGSTGKVKFEWFPAMHAAGDSELAPSFVGGVNYMAPLPTLEKLLKMTLSSKAEYTFTLHGNPFAGVSTITGSFETPTPYKTC